jgi:hypothetical protein
MMKSSVFHLQIRERQDLRIGMVKDMNKLRVKCIKCGREWKKDAVISWGPDDFTSSLCDPCFKEVISPIIHRKQLNEGNFDCFGKADTYCDQFGCKYIRYCFSTEGTGQTISG